MARLRRMPAVAAYEGLRQTGEVMRALDIYGGSSSGQGKGIKGHTP